MAFWWVESLINMRYMFTMILHQYGKIGIEEKEGVYIYLMTIVNSREIRRFTITAS